MIYDCFTFFNELELLELRLHELAPVVDHFVLVEATRTFSGQPKPLYFEENKSRFYDYLPKITHIVVSDFPSAGEDRWTLEYYQRDAISRGLRECQPDDIVIVSDIDEIVRSQAIEEYKDKPGIKFFRQRQYYYFFNCVCTSITWDRAKMVFYRDLRSPQWLRDYPKLSTHRPSKLQKKRAKYGHRIKQLIGPKDVYIDDGGWHFGYLGGLERIQQKIRSFSHSEYDKEEFLDLERLQRVIEHGEDLYGRNMNYQFIPLDDSFPRYLRDHPKRFASMIRAVS